MWRPLSDASVVPVACFGGLRFPWRTSYPLVNDSQLIALGRVDKLNPDSDAGKQHEGGEALDQLVVAGGDTA